MQLKLLLVLAPAVLAATVHNVDVGKSGLSFDPQTLSAQPGDKVVFTLFNDHDVAQSDFNKPCQGSGGFFSGTYSNDKNGALQFVLTINDTSPIYYYCTVPSHCQEGMVGGINLPTSGDTIAKYAAAAKDAADSERPAAVANGVLVSSGADVLSSASPAASGSSTPASNSASASKTHSGSSSASGSGSGSPTGSGATAASKTGSTGGAPVKTGSAIMLAGAGAVAALLL